MGGWYRTLPVNVECPQLDFIVKQYLGIVSVWKVDPDNFLILRVQVVKPPARDVVKGRLEQNIFALPVHDGQCSGSVDLVFGRKNGSPVTAIATD